MGSIYEHVIGQVTPNDIIMSPVFDIGTAGARIVDISTYGRYFDFIDFIMSDIGTASKVEIGDMVRNRWPIKFYGSTDYYSLPIKESPYDIFDFYVKETNTGATHASMSFIGCKHRGAIIERRA